MRQGHPGKRDEEVSCTDQRNEDIIDGARENGNIMDGAREYYGRVITRKHIVYFDSTHMHFNVNFI